MVAVLALSQPSCGGCTDTGLVGETDTGADPAVDTDMDTDMDPDVDVPYDDRWDPIHDPGTDDVGEDGGNPCGDWPNVTLPDLGDEPWARFEGEPVRLDDGSYEMELDVSMACWVGSSWMLVSSTGHAHVRGLLTDGTAWDDWVAIQPSLSTRGTPVLSPSGDRIGFAVTGCESGIHCSTWGGIVNADASLISGLHRLAPEEDWASTSTGTTMARAPDGNGWIVAWAEETVDPGMHRMMIVHVDQEARATTGPVDFGFVHTDLFFSPRLVTVCDRVVLLWLGNEDLMMATLDAAGTVLGPGTSLMVPEIGLFEAAVFRGRIAVASFAFWSGSILWMFIDPVTGTVESGPSAIVSDDALVESWPIRLSLESLEEEGYLVLAHSVIHGGVDPPPAHIHLDAVDGMGEVIGSPLVIEQDEGPYTTRPVLGDVSWSGSALMLAYARNGPVEDPLFGMWTRIVVPEI